MKISHRFPSPEDLSLLVTDLKCCSSKEYEPLIVDLFSLCGL